MELRRSEVKEIEGIRYEITQLGAVKGSRVFIRVLKLLGPAFMSKGHADMGALFDRVREEDFEALCDAFKPVTMVLGVGMLDQVFDIHFTGRYGAMLKWLWACLELNYGDFLKGPSPLAVAQAVGQTGSASLSQPTATGSSGVS